MAKVTGGLLGKPWNLVLDDYEFAVVASALMHYIDWNTVKPKARVSAQGIVDVMRDWLEEA